MKKKSGILLHPTSLPSPYGIGDLGESAYQFLDFLADAQQKVWQILPLTPPDDFHSPYQSLSAFAGNPFLISPDGLLQEGLLEKNDLTNVPSFPREVVDFQQVIPYKTQLLEKAYRNFSPLGDFLDFPVFLEENRDWLPGYSLFMALREHFNRASWGDWPGDISLREEEALNQYQDRLQDRIQYHSVLQYLFSKQWQALYEYAEKRQVQIMGDLPIFVAYESSDVWENPHLFTINAKGGPAKVAGVPPDYFSSTGQRWGNPLYRWDRMKKDDYAWWRRRVQNLLQKVHLVRIDHFRGFEAYWEIPAREKTAVNGQWVKGPGEEFFQTLEKYLGEIPIVAEDLGFITREVTALRKTLGYPGMKVLQFAIEGGEKELQKVRKEEDILLYTGTHDNDTMLGWYRKAQQNDEDAIQVAEKLLHIRPEMGDEEICWRFMEQVLKSRALMGIFPLQDILAQGEESRMNTPGTFEGNWGYRYQEGQITREITQRLRRLTSKYVV